MFYSRKSQVIDHHLTYLHSQKVFTGQYWDEFALTCSLIPDHAKVLMLGLALGGGIRPLFSSTKKIELTCVDYDKESVQKCRDLYQKCFPDIQFKTITADAKEFLKNDDQKYDAIWFDIYADAAYSTLAFDPEFMNLIQRRLTVKGALLVNAYGLPNHFSPLTANNIQQNCASFLKSQFGFAAAIPFRRNMTLVVSSASPTQYPVKANESLNAMDQFTFDFIQKKVSQQIQLDELAGANKIDPHQMQFAAIDTHMRQCWSNLRERLNSSGFDLKENREFISLIQNPERCEKVILHLISKNDLTVCFLPILASGESHLQELNIDWLFDWTEKNRNYLSESLKTHFQLIWLTQLWALVIHPHGRYKKFYFRFLTLMQNL